MVFAPGSLWSLVFAPGVLGVALLVFFWCSFGGFGFGVEYPAAMDSKAQIIRKSLDGQLQCTSSVNKMKDDAPASRGPRWCIYMWAQLMLWYFCRSSA